MDHGFDWISTLFRLLMEWIENLFFDDSFLYILSGQRPLNLL